MDDAKTFLSQGDVLDALNEAECRALLATATFGRVGVTSGGLPVIFPVRYVFAGETITFRTAGGTKLRAAANGDVLAFEVDHFDPDTNVGWSVLVLGRAVVLTTEHEHDGLPSLDNAEAGEPCNHYVRLHCELVTGRRLAPSPLAPTP